jgi:hypothetical protein
MPHNDGESMVDLIQITRAVVDPDPNREFSSNSRKREDKRSQISMLRNTGIGSENTQISTDMRYCPR